ncbi:MAG: FprA family A-type flavoprotein, partial [Agathobacter sp.]|nr:FprA family A-type flavoprotein [Agathobacter sp.]
GEENVVVADIMRSDMAEVVEDAFRYDRMVLAAASYDAGVFPQIRDFLYRLQMKNFQKRKVGIMENGTWSPSAARVIKELLEQMKEIEIVEPMVTVYSTIKEENIESMKALVEAMRSGR